MPTRRVNTAGTAEVTRTLALVIDDIRRATEMLGNFEQFAASGWERDSYLCFDWVALSRRMYDKPKLILKNLYFSRNPALAAIPEAVESVALCHELLVAVTERSWLERTSDPKEIVITVESAVERLESIVGPAIDAFRKIEGSGTATGSDSSKAMKIVQTARAEAPQRKALTSAEILADPAASFWLKNTLRSALDRDPVDVANDAETLVDVLNHRCREALEAAQNSVTVIPVKTSHQAAERKEK